MKPKQASHLSTDAEQHDKEEQLSSRQSQRPLNAIGQRLTFQTRERQAGCRRGSPPALPLTQCQKPMLVRCQLCLESTSRAAQTPSAALRPYPSDSIVEGSVREPALLRHASGPAPLELNASDGQPSARSDRVSSPSVLLSSVRGIGSNTRR